MEVKSVVHGQVLGQGYKPGVAIEMLTHNGISTRTMEIHFPHGNIGDKLLVREAWAYRVYNSKGDIEIKYASDGETAIFRKKDFDGIWTMPKMTKSCLSPISMPAWATRFVLEINSIEVKRLSEISDEEADAIGVESYYSEKDGKWYYKNYFPPAPEGYGIYRQQEATIPMTASESLRSHYISAKTSRNKKFNPCPHVWLFSFEAIRLPPGTFNTLPTTGDQAVTKTEPVKTVKVGRPSRVPKSSKTATKVKSKVALCR